MNCLLLDCYFERFKVPRRRKWFKDDLKTIEKKALF